MVHLLRQRINSYSFLGFLKFTLMKLRGRMVYLRGNCLQCGTCCQSINIEGPKGWIRKEHEFYAIIANRPEYDRFFITGRDDFGYLLFCCTKLTNQQKCSCYEDRLPMCKKYPDKSLAFVGGVLPQDCGYKITIEPSFKKILRKKMLG